MPSMSLNHQSIKGLKPAAERYDVFDTDVTGFAVRVSPSGRKTFQIAYRVGARKRWRRHKLGVFPALTLAAAREEARTKLELARKGIDPAEQRATERAARSFADLAHAYMAEYAIGNDVSRRAAFLREQNAALTFVQSVTLAIAQGGKPSKRSWKEDHRILFGSSHTKPTGKTPHVPIVKTWGNRAFADITANDIDALLEQVMKRAAVDHNTSGRVMANRVRALISTVWNFAISKRWTTENICTPVAKPIADEREIQRHRVLSRSELRQFWAECEKEHPIVAAVLKMHLLTAQRSAEVKRMAWSEIDFEDATWTIPAERSKNKFPHRVPLVPDAIKILKQLRAAQLDAIDKHGRPDTPWVFQSTRSRKPKPIAAVQKATERIRQRCGFITETNELRTHDLRRTAASHMTSIKIPRFIVRQVLNHADEEITAVYDRYGYDREKRDALTQWAKRLAEIIAHDQDDSAEVITFSKRTRRA